jgi:MbtH protein
MSDVKGDYAVVVNHEEQYSVWPLDREPPAGWSRAGQTGSRDECLAWIDANWTDMRPSSLRRSSAMASSRADARPDRKPNYFGGSGDAEK